MAVMRKHSNYYVKIRAIRTVKMIFLSLFAVSTLFPFFWVLLSSFKTTQEIYGHPFALPEKWMFSNYVDAWKGALINYTLVNSLIYTVLSVFAVLVVSSMAAYIIARFRHGRILQGYFAFGIMVPIHAVIIPLNLLFKKMGLTNTRLSLIIAFVVLNTSFSIFIISAFMKQLPRDIEEAAIIDGCSRVQMFVKIVLPICKSALATAGTLTFINCWNDLLLSLTLISTSTKNTLNYSVYSLKSEFISNYGTITAGIIILIVPVLLAYCIFQEQIIKGMVSGAVKG
ncbi:carbohydrate ABC transporter permease [Faecalicatena contorta]